MNLESIEADYQEVSEIKVPNETRTYLKGKLEEFLKRINKESRISSVKIERTYGTTKCICNTTMYLLEAKVDFTQKGEEYEADCKISTECNCLEA